MASPNTRVFASLVLRAYPLRFRTQCLVTHFSVTQLTAVEQDDVRGRQGDRLKFLSKSIPVTIVRVSRQTMVDETLSVGALPGGLARFFNGILPR